MQELWCQDYSDGEVWEREFRLSTSGDDGRAALAWFDEIQDRNYKAEIHAASGIESFERASKLEILALVRVKLLQLYPDATWNCD